MLAVMGRRSRFGNNPKHWLCSGRYRKYTSHGAWHRPGCFRRRLVNEADNRRLARAFVLIPIGEVTIIAVAPNAAKTSVVMRQSSFSCIETNTAAGAMRAIGQVVAALLFRDEIGPTMGAFGPLRYSAHSEANTRIKGRVYASKSRFW